MIIESRQNLRTSNPDAQISPVLEISMFDALAPDTQEPVAPVIAPPPPQQDEDAQSLDAPATESHDEPGPESDVTPPATDNPQSDNVEPGEIVRAEEAPAMIEDGYILEPEQADQPDDSKEVPEGEQKAKADTETQEQLKAQQQATLAAEQGAVTSIPLPPSLSSISTYMLPEQPVVGSWSDTQSFDVAGWNAIEPRMLDLNQIMPTTTLELTEPSEQVKTYTDDLANFGQITSAAFGLPIEIQRPVLMFEDSAYEDLSAFTPMTAVLPMGFTSPVSIAKLDGEVFILPDIVEEPKTELVVINNDGHRPIDEIVEGALAAGREVLIINPGENGIEKINQYLDQQDTQYDAIVVYSHGINNEIILGDYTITDDNVEQSGMDGFAEHLKPGADIIFASCNAAEGDSGKSMIDKIADMTGADVGASTDSTGNSENGDWDLEYTTGDVSTEFSDEVTENYTGTDFDNVLATWVGPVQADGSVSEYKIILHTGSDFQSWQAAENDAHAFSTNYSDDWYLATFTTQAEYDLYLNQIDGTNEGPIDQANWTGAWFGAVANNDGTNDYIWGDDQAPEFGQDISDNNPNWDRSDSSPAGTSGGPEYGVVIMNDVEFDRDSSGNTLDTLTDNDEEGQWHTVVLDGSQANARIYPADAYIIETTIQAPTAVGETIGCVPAGESTFILAAELLGNDTDPANGVKLVPGSGVTPDGTSYKITEDGITITGNATNFGTSSIPYTVSNDYGLTNSATLTVEFDAAPDAVSNEYEIGTTDGLSGNVITDDTGTGVDSDLDGDPLSVISNTDPSSGTVTMQSDGSFTWEPDPAGTPPGTYSFTYTIEGGCGEDDTATVTFVVQEPPTVCLDTDDDGVCDTEQPEFKPDNPEETCIALFNEGSDSADTASDIAFADQDSTEASSVYLDLTANGRPLEPTENFPLESTDAITVTPVLVDGLIVGYEVVANDGAELMTDYADLINAAFDGYSDTAIGAEFNTDPINIEITVTDDDGNVDETPSTFGICKTADPTVCLDTDDDGVCDTEQPEFKPDNPEETCIALFNEGSDSADTASDIAFADQDSTEASSVYLDLTANGRPLEPTENFPLESTDAITVTPVLVDGLIVGYEVVANDGAELMTDYADLINAAFDGYSDTAIGAEFNTDPINIEITVTDDDGNVDETPSTFGICKTADPTVCLDTDDDGVCDTEQPEFKPDNPEESCIAVYDGESGTTTQDAFIAFADQDSTEFSSVYIDLLANGRPLDSTENFPLESTDAITVTPVLVDGLIVGYEVVANDGAEPLADCAELLNEAFSNFSDSETNHLAYETDPLMLTITVTDSDGNVDETPSTFGICKLPPDPPVLEKAPSAPAVIEEELPFRHVALRLIEGPTMPDVDEIELPNNIFIHALVNGHDEILQSQYDENHIADQPLQNTIKDAELLSEQINHDINQAIKHGVDVQLLADQIGIDFDTGVVHEMTDSVRTQFGLSQGR